MARPSSEQWPLNIQFLKKAADGGRNVEVSKIASCVIMKFVCMYAVCSKVQSCVMWCGVVWCDVRWGGVRWGEVRWGEVRWGEVRWGDVMWGDVDRPCAGRARVACLVGPVACLLHMMPSHRNYPIRESTRNQTTLTMQFKQQDMTSLHKRNVCTFT